MGGTRVRMKFLLLSLRPGFVPSGSGHLGCTGIYDIKAGAPLGSMGLLHLIWSPGTGTGSVY